MVTVPTQRVGSWQPPCSSFQKPLTGGGPPGFLWLALSMHGSCPPLGLPVTHFLCLRCAPCHLSQPYQTLSPSPEASFCPCQSLPRWQRSEPWAPVCTEPTAVRPAWGWLAAPPPSCPQARLPQAFLPFLKDPRDGPGAGRIGKEIEAQGEGTTHQDPRQGRGTGGAMAWYCLQASPAWGVRSGPIPDRSACSPGTSSLLRLVLGATCSLWPSCYQALHLLSPPVHSRPDSSSLAHSLSLEVFA